MQKIKKSTKIVNFDHASATPISKKVFKEMEPYFSKIYGNPSSLHQQGREAKSALENARQLIADTLKVFKDEVIFTAGATESVNIAILGAVLPLLQSKNKLNIITTPIEHDAVLETFHYLKSLGIEVRFVNVNKEGSIDFTHLKKLVDNKTILVSVIYANNEIGTIQPLHQISKVLKTAKQSLNRKLPLYFHSDLSQAPLYLKLDINKLGLDMASLNGGKIFGPKQSGLLIKKREVKLSPITYGGGQEQSLRVGTENVSASVGIAMALSIAQKSFETANKEILKLSKFLLSEIIKTYPSTKLVGTDWNLKNDRQELKVLESTRLPNHISITLPGIEAESLVVYLDNFNILTSTGSACSNIDNKTSHVISALGKTPKEAKETLRITLGPDNTLEEIKYFIKVFKYVIPLLSDIRNDILKGG